jgi:hypothetical protein
VTSFDIISELFIAHEYVNGDKIILLVLWHHVVDSRQFQSSFHQLWTGLWMLQNGVLCPSDSNTRFRKNVWVMCGSVKSLCDRGDNQLICPVSEEIQPSHLLS